MMVPIELVLFCVWLFGYVAVLYLWGTEVGNGSTGDNRAFLIFNFIFVTMFWPIGLPFAFALSRFRRWKSRRRLREIEGGDY